MAGFVDFFGPRSVWDQLLIVIDDRFWDAVIAIDGLMGQYYPGHDEAWVDYDEGLLYG